MMPPQPKRVDAALSSDDLNNAFLMFALKFYEV